jgi:hypothetical protein
MVYPLFCGTFLINLKVPQKCHVILRIFENFGEIGRNKKTCKSKNLQVFIKIVEFYVLIPKIGSGR